MYQGTDRVENQKAYALSEGEAFRAMSLFVDQFLEHGGNDLATLSADIQILEDGSTTDPAAWQDFMNCVRAIKGEPPITGGGVYR